MKNNLILSEGNGMIPKAKIEAWLKAPPENASINPRIPVLLCAEVASFNGSIPGNAMCAPIR